MSFIENYNHYIQGLKAEKMSTIDKLLDQCCEDDAKLCKIELNIVEIFEKMFQLGVQKAEKSPSNPLGTLKETYLGYFDKIPMNWMIELEKCETFGNHEGAHIERLKLGQADAMKAAFIEMLSKDV